MAKTYSFTTEVSILDSDGFFYDAKVEVEYSYSGRYIPQTYDHPAEYPEVELLSVKDLETDEELLDIISQDDLHRLFEEADEDLSN
jgi:hypothetical protein